MAKISSRGMQRKRRHSRIRNKVVGSAERPRLSIFRSARHIYAQAIDDLSGRTLASASTLDKEIKSDIKTYSGNKEAAKTIGKVIAERLAKAGVKQVVFDRGGNRYHGRIQVLADSAREAGLRF